MGSPSGPSAVTVKRLATRLSADALRQVRGGHPWVFSDSITSIAPGGSSGDLAVVFDDKRRFVAIGLYDPASPIRVKLLHQGAPRQIDNVFWRDAIAAALGRRAGLRAARDTTGYRLVNGESDGFPGLVVDVYGDVAVVKLYTPAWYPHLAAVTEALVEAIHPRSVMLRLARSVPPAGGLDEGSALHGSAVTEPVMFLENGLVFEADVVNGQKTGHFLDQRDNRQLLRTLLAPRATVLDVFASTGGFTVYAAAAGAASVTSVDASAPTLAVASRNLAHNIGVPEVAACAHEPIVADAFETMERFGRTGRKYDAVVVDPPSFAQRQANVDTAIEAYRRLAGLASRLVADGGLLIQASCSSRVQALDFFRAVHAGSAQVGRTLTEVRRTAHAVDHPATIPEAHYLKAIFATVQRDQP